MKVFITQTCTMVAPVLHTLDQLNIEYEVINIDHDPAARAQLRQYAQGNESVPTLVLDDGRVLVEPSPAQLHQLFGVQPEIQRMSINNSVTPITYTQTADGYQYPDLPKRPHNVRVDQIPLLLGILGVFVLGLLAFALGYGLSSWFAPQFQTGMATVFISGTLLLVLGSVLLSVPPVRKVMRPISRVLSWKPLQAVMIFAYAGLMGFTIGLLHLGQARLPLGVWLPILVGFVGLMFIVARLTRPIWQPIAPKLQGWQRIIGYLTSFGFVGLFMVTFLASKWSTPLLLILLPTFSLALLCRILIISSGTDQSQIFKHGRGLLFICLSTLIWLAVI